MWRYLAYGQVWWAKVRACAEQESELHLLLASLGGLVFAYTRKLCYLSQCDVPGVRNTRAPFPRTRRPGGRVEVLLLVVPVMDAALPRVGYLLVQPDHQRLE